MSSILGQYKNNYSDIFEEEVSDYYKKYRAYNRNSNKYVILKIFNKKQIQLGEYNLVLKQISNEEIITKKCDSEYIVKLYQKFETPDSIIFEYEFFEDNMHKYLYKNGALRVEENFFKYIVITLAKALYIIHQNGAMHRNITPYNIFIDKQTKKVKLGCFDCSTFIKENTSIPIGSLFYNAPEIIKNIKYDEKCDLWSLGVTLYELYFGQLPYGIEPNSYIIKKTIYNEKNFIFKKSKIPTLDILFKRLLVINPKYRMTFSEFFSYVLSPDFMKKDVIFVNNNYNYNNIYMNILQEMKMKNNEEKIDELTIHENCNKKKIEKKITKKIIKYIKEVPDIMSFPDWIYSTGQKFNNIIYYNENKNCEGSIDQEINYFEKHTCGAFIFCANEQSLNLVKEEILKAVKNDQFIKFNIITAGSSFQNLMKYLETNPELNNCILKISIFCFNMNKKNYEPCKQKYTKLYGIYDSPIIIVKEFIEKLSSEKIKPFQIAKLITYEIYKDKYKERHKKVAKFYGDLNPEAYKKYFDEIKSITDIHNRKEMIDSLTFNLEQDINKLTELIIKRYTGNNLHPFLNQMLLSSDFYEAIAYFTGIIMYNLNKYAREKKKYCVENQKVTYRGMKLPYTCLIQYERSKGKIICFSGFSSTSESKDTADTFAGRNSAQELYKTNLKFSVILEIRNIYKDGLIPNSINIQDLSVFGEEKEYLFQPFSFFYVQDVHIDINNKTADIVLETIGKKEILEEKIRNGYDIRLIKKDKIIEIKK